MIPVGTLALGPVPSTGFGVVVLEGGASSPAGVYHGVVVVEHPVGTGVVQTRMKVVLAKGFGHPSLSVVGGDFVVTFDDLVCLYLRRGVRAVYLIFSDRIFLWAAVDANCRIQSLQQLLHEVAIREWLETIYLPLIPITGAFILASLLEAAVDEIEYHRLLRPLCVLSR